jgi:8-oxo-dGTP diphosphatase
MENKRPVIILVNRCFILNEKKEILLVKRCATDRKDPEKWEVPGGKLDEGEDLIVSTAREIMEETGLILEQTNPLVFVDSHIIENGRYEGFTAVSLFSINKIKSGEVVLSEEHTEYVWASYEDVVGMDITSGVKKASEVLRDYLLNI